VPDLIRSKSRIKKTVSIELFDRKAIECADTVHFTSEQEKGDCESARFKTKKCFVLPNGINLSEIPEETNTGAADSRYVLYLGRINWKKGIDQLIGAMAHLPDTRLVVAGNDEEKYKRELLSLAVEVGVSKRIEYVGPVYAEDKWRLLAEASVLVLPSRSENFGNVVLEAMAVGTPVIVTKEVGICDEVKISSAGLISDGSAVDLAEKIRQMLNDTDRSAEMGSNGRSVVRQKYDWSVIATRMEKIYSELCENGNR
jgi:glycosyltransferase involved in cell wall biosynthesis